MTSIYTVFQCDEEDEKRCVLTSSFQTPLGSDDTESKSSVKKQVLLINRSAAFSLRQEAARQCCRRADAETLWARRRRNTVGAQAQKHCWRADAETMLARRCRNTVDVQTQKHCRRAGAETLLARRRRKPRAGTRGFLLSIIPAVRI